MTLGEFTAAAFRRWTFRGIRVSPLIIITYRDETGTRPDDGDRVQRGVEAKEGTTG